MNTTSTNTASRPLVCVIWCTSLCYVKCTYINTYISESSQFKYLITNVTLIILTHIINSSWLHKYPNTMMNTYTVRGTGVLLVVCKDYTWGFTRMRNTGIYWDLLSAPPETRLTCRHDCCEEALETLVGPYGVWCSLCCRFVISVHVTTTDPSMREIAERASSTRPLGPTFPSHSVVLARGRALHSIHYSCITTSHYK